MRTKTEYVVEQNERGKQVPRKVGTAPVQRDGVEYEFDIVADMDLDNNFIVSKTRCSELTGVVISKPAKEVAEIILRWLKGSPAPEKPQFTAPAPMAPVAAAEPTTSTGGNGKTPVYCSFEGCQCKDDLKTTPVRINGKEVSAYEFSTKKFSRALCPAHCKQEKDRLAAEKKAAEKAAEETARKIAEQKLQETQQAPDPLSFDDEETAEGATAVDYYANL